jgi:hypothetical protein
VTTAWIGNKAFRCQAEPLVDRAEVGVKGDSIME